MGFMNTYRLHSTGTDTSYLWEKRILEFFGFKVRKTSSSSIETYGGNTYATRQTDGSYKLETSPTGLYNRTRYYTEYYRDKQPTAQEQALEDRFVTLMEQKRIDWTNAPYVEPSLEAYHKNKSKIKSAKTLKNVARVLAIVGLGFFLGTSLFQSTLGTVHTGTPLENAFFGIFAKIDPTVAIIGTAAGWIGAIIFLITSRKAALRFRNTPVCSLPQAERNAVRQQYHEHLRATYAGEMGDVLVEYAKLQEK